MEESARVTMVTAIVVTGVTAVVTMIGHLLGRGQDHIREIVEESLVRQRGRDLYDAAVAARPERDEDLPWAEEIPG